MEDAPLTMKKLITVALLSLCCCDLNGFKYQRDIQSLMDDSYGRSQHVMCYSGNMKVYDGYSESNAWVHQSYLYFKSSTTHTLVEISNAACVLKDAESEREQ